MAINAGSSYPLWAYCRWKDSNNKGYVILDIEEIKSFFVKLNKKEELSTVSERTILRWAANKKLFRSYRKEGNTGSIPVWQIYQSWQNIKEDLSLLPEP